MISKLHSRRNVWVGVRILKVHRGRRRHVQRCCYHIIVVKKKAEVRQASAGLLCSAPCCLHRIDALTGSLDTTHLP